MYGVRGEPLHVVQLGKLSVVVGRSVVGELLLGLLAEVASVYEKQYAPRTGELDQPVDRCDCQQRKNQ